MDDADWTAVDDYIAQQLLGDDDALSVAMNNNRAHGLPSVDVSAAQGKMLYLLAKMAGAKRVLEIGTLGGFSTIWLARALPAGGKVVTLEFDPTHARVARENVDQAGVGERIDIRVGLAKDSLAAITDEAPFDFIFIDADKASNVHYVREAIRLGRSGTAIIVDDVVREGQVLDADSKDDMVVGTRKLFAMLQQEERLDATAIQTVGSKGWDGFVLALIR